MPSAWRIVKARYAATAFTGESARRNGGRWNSPRTALVYTSQARSLALLEILAHLGSPAVLTSYVLIECRFDPGLVIPLQRAILSKNWQTFPSPPALQVLGDQWVKLGHSAVLEVPSVLVPQESNYLLNPAHADFRKIEILDPVPFRLDMRLVRGTS